MKSFDEWWEGEACRVCCDTHEERARYAWCGALLNLLPDVRETLREVDWGLIESESIEDLMQIIRNELRKSNPSKPVPDL